MILDAWLKLPTVALFGALATLLAANVVLLYVVAFKTAFGSWIRTCTGVVAPFFNAVAILFSLLTGFVANDVWDRNRQAARAVLSEADDVRALHNLSIASASDMADIRQALLAYVHSVINDEWPSMARHESSPQAETALAVLLNRVSQPRITTEAGSAVHGALLAIAMRIGTARHDRLVLGNDRSDESKWAVVLVLALFTQLAIGTVHLERPRAFVLTLCIFSAAAAIALGLIAVREQPFANPQLTTPSGLQAWLNENGQAAK